MVSRYFDWIVKFVGLFCFVNCGGYRKGVFVILNIFLSVISEVSL